MRFKRAALAGLLCIASIPAHARDCTDASVQSCSDCKDSCNQNCGECNSHTFFRPRSLSQNLTLEESLSYYYGNIQDKDDCIWLSFQVVAPIYYSSIKSTTIGTYFSPNCDCNCFTVAQQNNTANISSAWLGILADLARPFQSTVCLEGRRQVIGGAVRLMIDFGNFFDERPAGCWSLKNWWLSIFIPVIQARHNFSLSETGTNNGILEGHQNATQALTNKDLLFGRLYSCQKRKSGVDDVAIKLGFDALRGQSINLASYCMLFAPAGHESKAKYLFEPTMGSGGHTGIGFGITCDAGLWESDEISWIAMLEARYAYFLKHKEHRVFDLCKNGNWSRYLQFVCESDPATPFPGVNVLSRDAQVTPGSMAEVWAALNFGYCALHVEVGYDFWYRHGEKIELNCQKSCKPSRCTFIDCDFIEPAGNCDGDSSIFDIAGCCPRVSASTATIFASIRGPGQPVSDTTFTPITDADLNLASAAVPKALTSTVYGAVSLDYCVCGQTGIIGVGGSYDFVHNNSAALRQYGVWMKLAIDY